MTPEDPRHGSTKGYHAGCHQPCCLKAIARYEKAGRLARLNGGRAVPAIGAQRRLQALMRLGWTSTDIADAAGWSHRNHVFRIIKGQKGKPTTWLEKSTDATVRRVYELLSMSIPDPSPARARTRSLAAKKGYAPPLAWDNIDDIDEGSTVTDDLGHDAVDHAVVERVLAGDMVPTTFAERVEITRRWEARGRSLNELERATGWKSDRYTIREQAAS